MLEALEDAGVDMMFDCRKGECGLCEVRILELDGAIDHRDVFYSERQQTRRKEDVLLRLTRRHLRHRCPVDDSRRRPAVVTIDA